MENQQANVASTRDDLVAAVAQTVFSTTATPIIITMDPVDLSGIAEKAVLEI